MTPAAGQAAVPNALGAARPGWRVLDPDDLGDHLDRMYRAAWALTGSREQAEDLVQETYARVLTRPRLLRGTDDRGYLLRALRNTFVSERRAAGARPVGSEGDELEYLEDHTVRGPAESAETHLVYEAIAELGDAFRQALIAVDLIGLSYREAARALRVREGTLTSRVFRARAQVARALDPAHAER